MKHEYRELSKIKEAFFFKEVLYLGFPFICLANIIILLSSEIKKNISSKTTQNF